MFENGVPSGGPSINFVPRNIENTKTDLKNPVIRLKGIPDGAVERLSLGESQLRSLGDPGSREGSAPLVVIMA